MRKAVLAFAVCFWSSALFAEVIRVATRVIPLAGHTRGANGTMWVTNLTLTNNNEGIATVYLVFHANDGITRTRVVTLGAHEARLFEDVVAPANFPGENPESWLGQLEIRAAEDVSASAHIFTSDEGGGTFGSTYEGFDPTLLSTGGTMAGLVSSDRYRSNVAFANPAADDATYDYTLRSEDGVVVATASVFVPAHATRQIQIHDAAGISADDRSYLLTWSGNASGYAIGSIIDNVSGDSTSAQSVASGASTLFFPVIGKVAGGFSTSWSTSMAIGSTSDVPGEVTFLYRDGAGTSYTKTVPVAAHGTIRADDVNAFLGAPAGQGSLEVLASVRVAGFVRVFNTRVDGATFGSAVLPQESFVHSDRVRILGVRRDAKYRLNVAISNENASAATGVVRLYDHIPFTHPFADSEPVEEKPFSLSAGQTMQVSMIAGRDLQAGLVDVRTESGVAVTVLATNVDNRTGDTIIREVEQENERQDNDYEVVMAAAAATVGAEVGVTVANLANVSNISWDFENGDGGTFSWGTLLCETAGKQDVTAKITLANGTVLHDRETLHITDATPASSLDFTYSPADPQPGQEMTFTATGSSSAGVYEWKFPGGARKTGKVATFTFTTAGSFEVVLELEHADVFKTVAVGSNSSKTATAIDFTWTPESPRAHQTVTFVAALDGVLPPGLSIVWKMPDGNLIGNTVIWALTTPGTFAIEAVIMSGPIVGPGRTKFITVAP